ncbi:hypothetical protein C9374_010564 [Naegleria lovaniensis]|uniref:Uncharacterized protein n=1 Tax=Naegleria lovaniensis TaxID=51637 RepID=A0AA88GFJ0_NAELO|nr:uncharacterized protein C9374_010564 [Naegleria lovaniensis]KAG2374545.1 hypothetical protein C9374_010564 [Naegleria lovaniensis]
MCCRFLFSSFVCWTHIFYCKLFYWVDQIFEKISSKKNIPQPPTAILKNGELPKIVEGILPKVRNSQGAQGHPIQGW